MFALVITRLRVLSVQCGWMFWGTVFLQPTDARVRVGSESRIPNPNAKAASSLPLWLFLALALGLGIRVPNLVTFSWLGRVRVILCCNVTLACTQCVLWLVRTCWLKGGLNHPPWRVLKREKLTGVNLVNSKKQQERTTNEKNHTQWNKNWKLKIACTHTSNAMLKSIFVDKQWVIVW